MTPHPAALRLIVNGADSPLGLAVLDRLVAHGHIVMAIGAGSTAARSANTPQPDVHTSAWIDCPNLASFAATRAAFDAAVAMLGSLDGLIHLADAFDGVPIEHVAPDDLIRLYRVNIETAVNAIHAVLPHLGVGAVITCVGASSTEPAGPAQSPYDGAKSGVGRLINAFSTELRPRGIRINAVLPGMIDTPCNRARLPEADSGRWTSPGAIAEIIDWLTTDRTRTITGALFPVAGKG